MAYRPYIWRKNNPDKRLEQKRREKVRKALRDKGIFPPVGEPLNEQQKEIDTQISNNDFSYWDNIKTRKSTNGGIDKQTFIKIKSPEYLLWYRFKSKCEEKQIPFDLEESDIVIPELCEITSQPLSTSWDDEYKDNYYTLLVEDFQKGVVKDNIKVVSVLGLLIKQGARQLFQDDIQKQIYYRVKQSSKKRNLQFNIEPHDIIIPTHCPLLNVELLFDKVYSSSDNYYTIDRIDSSKGYVKDNVQIISLLANTMKNKATKDQLLTFSKNILSTYHS